MKQTILSVLASLALTSVSPAQPHQHSAPQATNTFTVDWVIAELRQHNPAIAAARANVEAAKERVTQAQAWDNPRATFDTRAGRFVSVPENSMTDQRLGIEQPLPISGKNRLRGNAAKSEAAISAE